MEYVQILLIALSLAMDAFAVSITDGLLYPRLKRWQKVFAAATFGVFQGVMPLIGFFIANLFYAYIKDVVPWIAFGLLVLIGGKMLIEGIIELRNKHQGKENEKKKDFSIPMVIIQGVATSIDALAVGVTLLGISTTVTIYIHVSIIAVITFALSLIGIFLGIFIDKLLKGKYEVAEIIGGAILILLGCWIVISHYCL